MTSLDLTKTAVRYLRGLHDDQTAPPPPGIDEAAPQWADAFLVAIREHRDTHPDSEARRAARRFGFSSAKDKYRFFWEFWQNADDAKASTLRFSLRPGELIVENDGLPFEAGDVYSVCFVASSQKEGDIAQKGQFGIGLLSLMRICEAPEMHSGPFHFRLERGYTYPGFAEGGGFLNGTKVVVPLKSDVDVDELREELLRRLEEEVLLYMSHLRAVEVGGDTVGATQRIECSVETGETGARRIRLGTHEWLQYRATVRTHPDLQREDGEPIPDRLPIVFVRCESTPGPHRVAAFFPTNVIHRLPWRFSAPFEVTTNREALLDSPYNRWLMSEVGRSMVDAALDPLVGDPSKPWRLVPGHETTEEDLRPLYQAAHAKLREISWIPTSRGLRRPDQVAIPGSPELRKLMNPKEVDDPNVAERAWLRGRPESEHRDLLKQLGAYLTCCHELSMVLASGPSRSPEWYLRAASEVIRLVEELAWDRTPVFERLREGNCFKNRHGRPFSLGNASRTGKFICSARSEHLAEDIGRVAAPYLVILHSVYRIPERKRVDPLDALRERVNTWLREESGERTFKYEYRLDAPQFIRHFIVEANQDDLARADTRTHDSLLSFVRDNLDGYIGAYRTRDRLERVGQNIAVAAFSFDESGKQIRGRRPLSEPYLGKSFTKSAWAHAASRVPGIWWLSRKYGKLLARESESTSVVDFLRKVGIREAPHIMPVPQNATHGTHSFTWVTRGDKLAYPHFPHDSIVSWYTEYGMRDDYTSPDLDAVLAFLARLPDQTKRVRGQQLLRTLEQQWDTLGEYAEAQAYAYYANSEHHIGAMPTRWLFKLRTEPWVQFADGTFRRPLDGIAATDNAREVLGARDPDLCAWDCNSVEVAGALGLGTTLSASSIIERLRRAHRENLPLSARRAASYYAALAKDVTEAPEALSSLREESLIYSPTAARAWWPPALCLMTDRRDIFGDKRAYLKQYRDAAELWWHLGVEDEPTLDNLVRLWSELSSSPLDREAHERLERSYVLANRLCESLTGRDLVPVWTDQGWQPSDRVVAVEDGELWTALGEPALPRWSQPNPSRLSDFCRWAQINLVDAKVEFGAPQGTAYTSDFDTRVLRLAVKRYAAEAAQFAPDMWETIAGQARDWVDLEVVRAECVEVPARVHLPHVGEREALVRRRALLYQHRLWLPSVTRIDDPEVVACLLRGTALAPHEIWNIESGIRVKLIEARSGVPDDQPEPPFPSMPAGEDHGATDLVDEDFLEEHVEEDHKGPAEGLDRGTESEPAAPQPPDVEDYAIESYTTGGDAPLTGGPVAPPEVSLRPPKRPTRTGAQKRERPRPPAKSVEQRGLDLFVQHVLHPAGIRISDQRLHGGVGADLSCSDGVFREMKTFSGEAPARIRLSRHEHARAIASLERYELVVVEHVWKRPIITRIPDPMRTLRWEPTGDIVVVDWREKTSRVTQIKLRPLDASRSET